MPKSRFRLVLILLLPALHLGACLVVWVANIDSGVEVIGRIDLPFTILIAPFVFWSRYPMVWIAVLGTLWWYLVSRFIDLAVNKILTWRRRREALRMAAHGSGGRTETPKSAL
jgi:hypothetical protein